MSQSQPLRIEDPNNYSFITARTINSLLWFVNNKKLEDKILGFLAKYRETHEMKLYSFVMQGNHYHMIAQYPCSNRASFFRDFNARIAECTRFFVKKFLGGPLFERRYSEQVLPSNEDIEEWFFYCALQPVQAGLCEKISDYPAYNSFYDAISGKEKVFKLVNWTKYNDAKRQNFKVAVKNYFESYTLKYERLPGYEKLSQEEYVNLMLKKLEERRVVIVNNLKAKGHIFPGKKKLQQTKSGCSPLRTKKSRRDYKRPLCLTKCLELKQKFLSWYFSIYELYKIASKKYLQGDDTALFPKFTYKPPWRIIKEF